MTCEKCQWWKDGICHKHPPKVIVVSDDNPYINNKTLVISTEWPTTYKDDYCGEFESEVKHVSKNS